MGRASGRRRVLRIERGEEGLRSRERSDVLAAEEPLEIRLTGDSYTVTMRTPGPDFELVAGFLFAEGLITGTDDLHSLRYCAGTDESGAQTYNVIDAQIDPRRIPAQQRQPRVLTSSACGICGTASIDAVHQTLPPPRASRLRIDPEVLLGLPDTLRDEQRLFDRTGGVHAAGLFDADGTLLCLREDVGRHNAVDKVVGWALLADRLPLTGTVLQVSGRASFELVQKAAMAQIELLSAVGAPSSLAVELAERAGLTLAGFSRGRSINVYGHPERIMDPGFADGGEAPPALR